MTLSEKIYNLISKDSLAYSGLNSLFSFMTTSLHASEAQIKQEFFKLVNRGEIFEIRKGKYIALPSHGYCKGKFLGNAKGYGFVQIGQSKGEHDIFIPANKVGGAIDGDKVIVKISFEGSEGSDGLVASVFKPVETLTGVVTRVNNTFFLEPDNAHIPFKIRLNPGNLKCNKNDRVVVKLKRNPSKLSAVVTEVLGAFDDIKAMELAIIRDHELYEIFPNQVLDASEKVPNSVNAKQKVNRRDLTKEEIFTIDGEDARDFDDAVSIKRTKTGYTLGVHIADVGEYVKHGSVIDEEAYKRGTSVYFPTSVLPMLPVKLSNGICSLNEGVERLTLSCIMDIDFKGKVTKHEICESVIKSVARLTYIDVYKVLSGKKGEKAEKVKESLLIMGELAKILERNRVTEGSLDFEIPEAQFIFDEKGLAIGVTKRERNDAHKLIEDFMVLANETVAKAYCIKGVPFVYRVHESPKKEKLTSLIEFLKGLNIKVPNIPDEVTPEYYQNLLKLISGHTYTETVNKVLLRSMQKAVYKNENMGHFGLALVYYCHFTSPIRRYPDLTIHRIIKETLHKKALSPARKDELKAFTFESSEQSSVTERSADLAEREVDDLWKAYLMHDKLGQEFEGVITSVTNYGAFIELENTVEGLLRIEDMPADNYLFYEKSLKLKGTKHTFSIGDRIKVILANANIYTRKVDFSLKNAQKVENI